jgi:hypothetical protein
MRYLPLACLIVLCLGGPTGQAQTKFTEARSTLEKWVETRQILAKERADWDVEKQALEQGLALLEKETKLLDEQIAKAEATATQADKERQKLIEENEQLTGASVAVRDVIDDLEKRTLELAKIFPPPLHERIEPLFKRIPRQPASTHLSLGERLQNVIGILGEVDKFNGSITVTSDLRQIPNGDNVQVKTIYLGLGAAYYVDKTGQTAGYGVPGPAGWKWTAQDALAPQVAKAIYVYENTAAAVFVNLPVILTPGGK